jgi:two-component system CheB/CheR fusion protein
MSVPEPTEGSAPIQPETPTPSLPFPVVGVGASAGGLEAFTRMLEHLPADPGFAVLLVLHLDPSHESMASGILSRSTRMPVVEATDGMPVQVNRVHVIPPNTEMALTDGKLGLRPRSLGRGQYMPVDHLFRSLANIQANRSIGVILSGGGTDGTLGLQEISASEGITFAQDERSARQTGMPRSAAASGYVDFVLPPDGIARELLRIVHNPYARRAEAAAHVTLEEKDDFARIFALLRASTSIDFSHYKRSTISRRIRRRMNLRGIERVADYFKLLQDDAGEAQALYQDLLIRVTSFFRDPDTFLALQSLVFPQLMHERRPDKPLRIWVAGCSTGEEVYSIAISFLEFLGDRAGSTPIKILATDISDTALEKARAGIYVENIEMDVSPDRLRRFFTKVNGNYQISKMIRDLCVFSRHNLVRDPPFSRLDLISCRNVLIYLNLSLQKRVMPIFHYALHPGGYLVLGTSETIGTFSDLFDLVHERQKIYVKKPVNSTMLTFDFDVPGFETEPRGLAGQESKEGIWTPLDLQREADRAVLHRFNPPGVVVDESLNILQFRGRTGPYLEPHPGTPNLNLLKMAREGLLVELRKAMAQAKAENGPVRRDRLLVKEGEHFRMVNVEVLPIRATTGGGRCFVVLFEDVPPPPPAPPLPPPISTEQDTGSTDSSQATEVRVAQLQQELEATREYLQSVIEENETTTEELKSAHEEILSSNEELQSTNEELQTAKEEMQSANEELATVNEELRHRNLELAKLNDDLVNLFSGVSLPIVVVGRDLRIRRITPLAEKVFHLIPTDVGRSFSDIRPSLDIPGFDQMIADVVESLTPRMIDAQDEHGRWYSVRVRPYITLENKIDGASITAVDINDLKSQVERLRKPEGSIAGVLNTFSQPLVVLDAEGRVRLSNPEFQRLCAAPPEPEAQFFHLSQGQWDRPELRTLLDNMAAGNGETGEAEVEVNLPGLGARKLRARATRLPPMDSEAPLVLLALEEVTS